MNFRSVEKDFLVKTCFMKVSQESRAVCRYRNHIYLVNVFFRLY